MPLIGIAPGSQLSDYEESVRRGGGDVHLIDRAGQRPADVVRNIDGLLLMGGGDIHPSLYGAAPHPTFSAAENGRDEYELDLVRRALDADLPILAICRGIQVLNVARGGTLVQDIPEQVGRTVDHNIREPRFAIAHDVWITTGSMLERAMRERLEGGEAIPVNSRHHQAPGTPGGGLIVSATAPDGVVEAIEDPDRRFCLGVQWHPENFWRTGEFRSLFEAFVNAAKK